MNLQARSKINLFLEVLSRRPDGYHDIDTVFQSIGLCDDLFFEKKEEGITLTVSCSEIPTDEQNLVYRAYILLKDEYPRKMGGIRVHLEKRIPVGAGLGGGSADAAATLLALNQIYELSLTGNELERFSLELGMDVPFCLKGGTAHASGRGEHMASVERKTDFQILIVHPGFSVSTKEAYEALDAMKAWEKRRSKDTLKALGNERVDDLWPTLYNSFERFVFYRHPVLNDLKRALLKGGCEAVLLTGSGAALCGYASPERDLEKLKSTMEKIYPFVVLTRPVQEGEVFIDTAEYSAPHTSIRPRRRT